jgi:UDP-glucose 4-epimerase
MAILVTGGAGYIGSATVELLKESVESVVVLDNLVNGHRAAIDSDIPFYKGDVGDHRLVERIVREHSVEACLHFAAYADVGESVKEPSKYFENNTHQTNILLTTLTKSNVKRFVFSSTCAIYGTPTRIPIDENHPKNPINPYGWSKLMTEGLLESYGAAYGLRFVSLRYFNAAGATRKCGERHSPETHLIPIALLAAEGTLPSVSVYGNDYDTPDGTCVLDYVHVADLAAAHLGALDYLRSGGDSTTLNLGNGQGFSVFDVIDAVRRVTGQDFEVRIGPRRVGDPDRLIADASKAHEVLLWKPNLTDVERIVASAWRWMKENPCGYERIGRV